MNNIYKFNTTLKASGNDYKKNVFWNRFLRNPIELMLTWIPAAISLVMLNTKDMPEDIKAITGQFIKEHVDLNKCKLAY